MGDIFISYASQDREVAKSLAEFFSNKGWSVWWDRKIPAGKRFAQIIEKAIADARCVVVLWSKASVASDWVGDEADEGRSRGILIPVLIEKIPLPMGFRRIHAADLSGWKGNADSPDLKKLVADIADMIGSPAPQPRNSQPKTNWLQGVLGAIQSSPPPTTEMPSWGASPQPPHPSNEYTSQCIRTYAITKFKTETGIDLGGDPIAMERLKEASDKAGKELSHQKKTRINLPYITADKSGPLHLDMELTQSTLERLIAWSNRPTD